ncbi:hypothetical protein IKQ26_07435 [bacterium]|nr:hypothetical protein [bacterium]
MLKVQPLFINNYKPSFSKKKSKSLVIEPPTTPSYSLMGEIYKQELEEKQARQKAAKSLIHENYRDRNTLKEKALIYLPAIGAFAALRIFAKKG